MLIKPKTLLIVCSPEVIGLAEEIAYLFYEVVYFFEEDGIEDYQDLVDDWLRCTDFDHVCLLVGNDQIKMANSIKVPEPKRKD